MPARPPKPGKPRSARTNLTPASLAVSAAGCYNGSLVFWQIVTIEARKRMSYRADFWLSAVVGMVAQIGIAAFIAFAVFRESGHATIGGYSLRGMILYFVVVSLVGRLVRSTEMEMGVSTDIYEGGLTRYLLYPASYGVFRFAQQLGALAPAAVQVLVLGAFVPFLFGGDARVTAATAAMCAASVAVANVLYFMIAATIQLVAFWAENVWSLMVANRIAAALLGGLMVPLSLYPEWARRILAWTPFPYLFAFPVDVLFGRIGIADWARGLAMSLGWCAVVGLVWHLIWRRGTLRYTGVGM